MVCLNCVLFCLFFNGCELIKKLNILFLFGSDVVFLFMMVVVIKL